MRLLEALDSPVAFHRVFAKITGSVKAGLLLSQFAFWHNKSSHDGQAFYNTKDAIEEATCLTHEEQDSARSTLEKLGFLEVKYERLIHRMWYRLKPEAIEEAIAKLKATISPTNQTQLPQLGNSRFGNTEITCSSNTERSTESAIHTPIVPKPNSSSSQPESIPESLAASDAFMDEWARWKEYRAALTKSKAKDLTYTFKLHLDGLSRFSPDIAVQMLRNAVENSWRKPFPLKDTGAKPPKNTTYRQPSLENL